MASPPSPYFNLFFFTVILLLPCANTSTDTILSKPNKSGALLGLKLTGMGAILIAGAIGVSLPFLGRRIPAFKKENNIFFIVKAFAGGVILATGFVHILPDAFDSLSSPSLPETPWQSFPFAGLVAMASAIFTMAIHSIATVVYCNRNSSCHLNKGEDIENDNVHVQTHVIQSGILRKRVVSKVLELGIVVHSIVIGISLGASESSETVRPLIVALCFHQFFEGIGLGGCISQAKLKEGSAAVMGVLFSVTTPMGVGIGMGVANSYDEEGVVALLVEGVLNSASAGMLIYMALVDLLASDFMGAKVRGDVRIQLGGYVALVLGVACMSALAIWA